MSKIYELSLGYRITKKLVISALYLYYDKITVTGIENIPKDGRIIFAPNHRNALMDALAIIAIAPKNVSTSFLARADIFKNKKIAAFLRFAKIMPAFRIRDGYENLGKNNDVFDECVDLLENNHALCIMPEGNQEMEHKVRPLVKGIFRIAFAVQQKNKSDRPLQIVPVGFDYGDIVKFGKHLIINVGRPIDVSDYSELYEKNPAVAINEIKTDLHEKLTSLTLHIDSEKNYETILQVMDFSYSKVLKNNNLRNNKLNRFFAQKQLAETLCNLEKNSPELFPELAVKSQKLAEGLHNNGIQSRNFHNKKSKKSLTTQAAILFLTSPVFIVGFVFNILPFTLPVSIRKILKIQYEGFFSSVQFVLGLICFPLLYVIQSFVVCSLLSVSALLVPVLIALQLVTGILAYRWYKNFKKTKAELNYFFMPEKEKRHLKELRKDILKYIGLDF